MSSIWTVRRSATDTKVTGLCGGVARHWDIDPLIVRVGCVLLALSGGVGVVLYAAGWLLMPLDGQDRRPIDDLFGGRAAHWSHQAWIAIVSLACIVAFAALGSVTPFGFGPVVILAAIWYFGYYRNRPHSAAPPTGETLTVEPPTGAPPTRVPPYGAKTQSAPPTQASESSQPDPAHQFRTFQGASTPFTHAAQAWQQRVAGVAATVPSTTEPDPQAAFLAQPDPVGLYVEAAPAPTVPRHRTRSARRLRLVGLVALGLVLSGLAVADQLGLDVELSGYLAAALLVVGLTLVAATWLGRARGILALGAVLLVGVLATSVAGPVASMEGWSSERMVYTAAADLPTAPITRDVGQLQIDLSAVSLTQDTTLTAHVDAGSLVVTVPEDTNVRVSYVVDSGVVTAFGDRVAGGADLHDTAEPVDADPTDPTLTLMLSVNVGKIQVQR